MSEIVIPVESQIAKIIVKAMSRVPLTAEEASLLAEQYQNLLVDLMSAQQRVGQAVDTIMVSWASMPPLPAFARLMTDIDGGWNASPAARGIQLTLDLSKWAGRTHTVIITEKDFLTCVKVFMGEWEAGRIRVQAEVN